MTEGGHSARVTGAGVVWSVALGAYVVAVMHRTTFGVSGVAAADRFDVAPDVLASFVLLQVGIYLAMQVPAGLLLDRFGSRALLATGSATMAAGQGLLATTEALPLVYVARFVVGTGDALIFVSVLALLPRWFEPRRVPLLTQVTATTGQSGQILSAVPFLALLGQAGWSATYASAAALGVLVTVLVVVVVRDSPSGGRGPVPSLTLPEIGRAIATVWRHPGTRLGYFSHMGSQFSGMVFALMWGVPYLVQGQNRSPATTGLLMTLLVVFTMVFAPLMGVFSARHPLRRSWLVLTVLAATALVWTAVLVLAEPAPLWLLVLLVLVLGAGGPGSVVGFDFARTFNERSRLGLAQSVVNLGGFTATLVVLQLVGWVMTAAGGYTFDAFRVAWLVQYPVWLLATVGLLVERRRTRALLAAEGITPRRLRDLWRSR
jgi:MFS family permease